MPTDKNIGPAKKPDPRNARLAEAQRRAKALTGGAKAPRTAGEFVAGLQQSLQDHWSELKKTTWPTQEVLTKSTTVVLALVVAVAIWVGAIDFTISRLENLIPTR
jgi:preprotein translocase subunit SecE